ncbi:MAG: hypothetical protein HC907_38320 [Richelia sp. SM1_7_0]|nr:hypothetical protein [Richelia sp. SM1_7_0]
MRGSLRCSLLPRRVGTAGTETDTAAKSATGEYPRGELCNFALFPPSCTSFEKDGCKRAAILNSKFDKVEKEFI